MFFALRLQIHSGKKTLETCQIYIFKLTTKTPEHHLVKQMLVGFEQMLVVFISCYCIFHYHTLLTTIDYLVCSKYTFHGAIALSYRPYCYWWLIMKKRGWKLYYRSPNPNPRGYESALAPISFRILPFL